MKGCMDDLLIKDKTTPLAYLASFLKLRNSFAVINMVLMLPQLHRIIEQHILHNLHSKLFWLWHHVLLLQFPQEEVLL